ncbi:unnamed protein product [Gongylonema pulchrum]|uniref:DNA-binding protein n=1 Tax=Gongylonema pulchrum TaxID=637853 RepID=A0A183DH12_9BILA|nr:unnamed protein product [Gongylonema pulchrum]
MYQPNIPVVGIHAGSFLFEIAIRTARVPGKLDHLLFDHESCARLEPKPKLDGYAPVCLGAILEIIDDPGVQEDRLVKVIKDSVPRIS